MGIMSIVCWARCRRATTWNEVGHVWLSTPWVLQPSSAIRQQARSFVAKSTIDTSKSLGGVNDLGNVKREQSVAKKTFSGRMASGYVTGMESLLAGGLISHGQYIRGTKR